MANEVAAERLVDWLMSPGVRNVMVAAGNSPLALYRVVAQRQLSLSHLRVFALDEYLGVPLDEPRNCANLIRRTVVEPWGILPENHHSVCSVETEALHSVVRHERRIEDLGGVDVIVLGLGRNGHLGFNEPGSPENSVARIQELDPVSVEANRQWFDGDYAPSRGVTVGMRTILLARRVLLLAFGSHKAAAVKRMVEGTRSERCPASLLQGHPETQVFLDRAAGSQLGRGR